MKNSITSKLGRIPQFGTLTLLALAVWSTAPVQAADKFWSGATASYTNAANWGGTVPGVADKAINDNGAGNIVQINLGDPDWIVNGILAGKSTGNGAFVQNGQNLYLTNATGRGAVRLGVATGRSGAYSINGGALNYTGEFNVGELGTATLAVNGGSIVGSGNLAINVGSSLDAVTGTMDGGTNKDGHTWFERGFYTPDATRGLPTAGSTVVSVSQADHSYSMPPSYAANNSVFLYNGLTNATITLGTPTAATALSFLGSSGGGEATLNYTIHHSGGANESGTLLIPDWYPPGSATVAVNVGGRVRANGFDFQNVDGAIDNPKLVSVDLALTDAVNPVTSIDLTYVSGGRAGLLAVSRSVGADFTPLAITGYNLDIVMGATEPVYVANTVTNILTQTAGAINITGEMWVGNVGGGIYNLNGGTNTIANWTVFGRSGGSGVLNMTGGVLNKTGNGNLVFGTPYQNLSGHNPSGVLNHSGGTINCQNGEVWFPEGSSSLGTVSGTYNLSGTAVMNVSSWFAVGRGGASGTLNMTGGAINKTGGGQPAIIIADGGGAVGQVTHSAGTITSSSELWIGQNGGTATYNLSGSGAINVNNWFAIGRGGNGANGTLTVTGGSINQAVNGVFIVGDNSQGYMSQSAGTVSARELWVGQGGSGNGTYDLSGTASLAVSGYVVIGRDGNAVMNMSGGTFTKTGGGIFIIASGNPVNSGTLNQSGGDLVSTTSEAWVPEGGTAFWNLSGSATATLSVLRLGRNGGSSGTLSLNGGTMTVNEIAGGDGTAIINFNGGTLVAGANNANFIHDLDTANVGADTLIDTAGFNVTVNQSLSGSSVLTKNGAGTLAFSAPNTYAGATTINTGGFGVRVTADDGQLSVASVNFAGSANAFDADLNTFGSPGAAPLSIAGALNVNGTVTVNILASGALQVGVYPLITCGSRTGAGTFALGSLPPNTFATLVDNGTSINLNITDVQAPRWEGLAGGNWDIGLTTNWINGGTGLPAYFNEGNEVVFNDAALGTTSVNLVATVHPLTVTVNNTNLSYTLSGSGKISGATGLAKQGTGTLTIANNNDYTGPTVISAGVVSVTNLANAGSPSPIGSGNLVLAGGTLSYAGPAAAINRGYSVQANSSIDAQGDLALSGVVTATSGFTKSGIGQLAYTGAVSNNLASGTYRVQDGSLLLSGPAQGQTNRISGALSLNGTTTALAIITNTTLFCGDLYVGNDSGMQGSVVIENGATIIDNSWFILNNGTGTINGGSITVPGRLFLCERDGTVATLNINGGTINKNGDYFAVVNGGWNGAGVLGRTGVVNQVAGTVGGGAEMWVGDGGGAGGNNSLGIYNLSGGTLTVNNWMGVGRDGCQGIFNLSGGTFNKGGGGDMVIGRGGDNTIGIFNMSGGTLNKSSGNPLIIGQNSGHGLFDQSGGTLTVDSEYWLGVDNNTTDATNNISGTAVFNINNWFSLGRGGVGVVNFSGGTITKSGGGNFIIGDNGTGYFIQTGGALTINNEFWVGQAGSGNGTFNMSAGTTTVGSWVAVGRAGATGVWNMSGGSFTKTGDNGNHFIVGSGGPATLNQTGGSITSVLSDTYVAENSDGTWNLDGGDAVLSVLHIPQNSGRVGVFNLNTNGTLTATEVTTGNAGGTGTLNFNGGTLLARSGANADFLHGLTTANVLSGGAVINSGTNVINVNQALLDGSGGGGLTKNGTGRLNLNGANTYTGSTLVNAGTLGGTGIILGPVSVATGASFAPGASIGTLTISNTLSLAATSTTRVEISLDGGTTNCDLVTGLTGVSYNGALEVSNVGSTSLVPGTVFKLFNSAAPGSGNFTSVTILPAGTGTFNPATGNLTITSSGILKVNSTSVAGGNLILTGEGGLPGSSYSWLTATNVATPNWVTNITGVFSGTGTFSNAFPVNPSEAARFFRLKTP